MSFCDLVGATADATDRKDDCMVTPRSSTAGLAVEFSGRKALLSERTARSDRQPRRDQPLSRRYEVAFLASSGDIDTFARVAPATPVFEDAFAALGRGTLISTLDGPTAVEDLAPGTLIETVGHGPKPVLWVGAMTLIPNLSDMHGGEAAKLVRFSPDAFGLGRPMPDLVLGPRARVLYQNARCREMMGASQAFAPARAFLDGVSVIEVTPAAPVRVYHVALHGQHTILANGLEVETYHPGPQVDSMMDLATREMFLSLFPHVEHLDGFGPMTTPRLTAFEMETLLGA